MKTLSTLYHLSLQALRCNGQSPFRKFKMQNDVKNIRVNKLLCLFVFQCFIFSGLFSQDSTQVEPVAEPIIDQQTEPVVDQATEPTAEPASEPAVKPLKEKKDRKPLKEKLYIGGYVNASLGRYTVIGAEPLIGYKVTPKLSTGVKFRYEYIVDKRYDNHYRSENYGGSVFSRFRVIKPIYLHAEFAMFSYEIFHSDGSSDREWIPFLFVGGGIAGRYRKTPG